MGIAGAADEIGRRSSTIAAARIEAGLEVTKHFGIDGCIMLDTRLAGRPPDTSTCPALLIVSVPDIILVASMWPSFAVRIVSVVGAGVAAVSKSMKGSRHSAEVPWA